MISLCRSEQTVGLTQLTMRRLPDHVALTIYYWIPSRPWSSEFAHHCRLTEAWNSMSLILCLVREVILIERSESKAALGVLSVSKIEVVHALYPWHELRWTLRIWLSYEAIHSSWVLLEFAESWRYACSCILISEIVGRRGRIQHLEIVKQIVTSIKYKTYNDAFIPLWAGVRP